MTTGEQGSPNRCPCAATRPSEAQNPGLVPITCLATEDGVQPLLCGMRKTGRLFESLACVRPWLSPTVRGNHPEPIRSSGVIEMV